MILEKYEPFTLSYYMSTLDHDDENSSKNIFWEKYLKTLAEFCQLLSNLVVGNFFHWRQHYFDWIGKSAMLLLLTNGVTFDS